MNSRRARITAALLLAVVAACEGTTRPKPDPSTAVSTTPAAPVDTCRRDQIVVLPRWGAALGSYGGSWRFLNVGDVACMLRPPAYVTVRDARGRVLLRSAEADGPRTPAIVNPGAMAEAIILWSNWCREETEVVLRVHLPRAGGAHDVVPPGTASCTGPARAGSTLSFEGFRQLDEVARNAVRTIAVQQTPNGIAADGSGIWVTGQDRLVRLDPEGRVVWAFDLVHADGALLGGGNAVAVGERFVWVTCACTSEPDPRFGATSGGVVRIDPRRSRVTAVRIFTDRTPEAVAAGNGAVWIATGNELTRLSTDDMSIEATIPLGAQVVDVSVGAGVVWAITSAEAEWFLAKIDAATNRVRSRWRLPDRPGGVVDAFGWVWVTAERSGRLLRIHPETGVMDGFDVASSADAVAAAGNSIWVTSFSDSAAVRVDPTTGGIVATFEVGTDPSDAAGAGRAVWVVSYSDWTVTRIPG